MNDDLQSNNQQRSRRFFKQSSSTFEKKDLKTG